MSTHRLTSIGILACVFSAALATAAAAQDGPTRPVRMVVGFGVGGGTDIVAQLMVSLQGWVLKLRG